MASKKTGRSFSADRELIEMAKKMDLAAIVKRTGRKSESILKTAKRLGVSIEKRTR
jgi:hypothetical protein